MFHKYTLFLHTITGTARALVLASSGSLRFAINVQVKAIRKLTGSRVSSISLATATVAFLPETYG